LTIGIGTGEQDRVGVSEIAIFKAYTKSVDALCFKTYGIPYKGLETEVSEEKRPAADKEKIDAYVKEIQAGLNGAVMVSDAFFPFRDGVDVAIREGISGVGRRGILRLFRPATRPVPRCPWSSPASAPLDTREGQALP
jgi:phosphoribosylaminoimidazolecarboxamide formyltransferase/IMP cyclohydrolase